MKKQILYTYLGTNGTITSPVHLEDVYYIRKNVLTAEKGCSLTKDNEHFFESVTVSDDEVELWSEVQLDDLSY